MRERAPRPIQNRGVSRRSNAADSDTATSVLLDPVSPRSPAFAPVSTR